MLERFYSGCADALAKELQWGKAGYDQKVMFTSGCFFSRDPYMIFFSYSQLYTICYHGGEEYTELVPIVITRALVPTTLRPSNMWNFQNPK